MKIIDLLNKIANEEEVPKHIHIRDVDNYTWREESNAYWVDTNDTQLLFDIYTYDINLNDEVEIIEEDKKINKPKIKPICEQDNIEEKILKVHDNTFILLDKIYEIIDKLNKE